jgi:hypothetical protein
MSGFNWYQRDDGIFIYEFKYSKRTTIDSWVKVANEHGNYARQNNLHVLVLSILHLRLIVL